MKFGIIMKSEQGGRYIRDRDMKSQRPEREKQLAHQVPAREEHTVCLSPECSAGQKLHTCDPAQTLELPGQLKIYQCLGSTFKCSELVQFPRLEPG